MDFYDSPLYLALLVTIVLLCFICSFGLTVKKVSLYLPSLAFASALVLGDILCRRFLASSYSLSYSKLVAELCLWMLTVVLSVIAVQFRLDDLLTLVVLAYVFRSVCRGYYRATVMMNMYFPAATIDELSVAPSAEPQRSSEEEEKPEDAISIPLSTGDT